VQDTTDMVAADHY